MYVSIELAHRNVTSSQSIVQLTPTPSHSKRKPIAILLSPISIVTEIRDSKKFHQKLQKTDLYSYNSYVEYIYTVE